MIKLPCVAISQLLNKKYFDLQVQEQRKITIEEFAGLFGAKKSLMTLWMNGKRHPGPEFKARIIERYGDEAVRAFGEDPRLYYINENWGSASEKIKDAIHEQFTGNVNKNDVRRTQGQRKKKRA